jgi:hypothetical protein
MDEKIKKSTNLFIKDYLVITVPEAEYKKFQVNMVNKNNKLNLINIEFKDFKRDFSFYYNCSEYKKLSEYIKDESINNEFILNMFMEIIKKHNFFDEYLLDFNKLIININYIFVDKNGILKFIYVPSNYSKIDNSLNNLFKELNKLNKFQVLNDNKIEDMIRKNKLKELYKYLNLLIDKNKDMKLNNIVRETNYDIKSIKNFKFKEFNITLEGLILGIFLQVLLLISFLFLNYFKMFPLINGSYTISFILFLIVFALFTAILWEIIIMNFRLQDKSNKKETIIKVAYLKNGNKEIILNKDEFFIGRLNDKVDLYLNDNKVGKIHAKIEKVKNKYYIYDLNSKNGTFINGNKVKRYKMFEILNNDKITFAFCDYQFIIQDKLV